MRESVAARKAFVVSCYSSLKKVGSVGWRHSQYFSEAQAMAVMKEILEVKDDWNEVLRIVDSVHAEQM